MRRRGGFESRRLVSPGAVGCEAISGMSLHDSRRAELGGIVSDPARFGQCLPFLVAPLGWTRMWGAWVATGSKAHLIYRLQRPVGGATVIAGRVE